MSLFVAVIHILTDFITAYLVPHTVADVNLLHIAIWTPALLGLVTGSALVLRRLARSHAPATTVRARQRSSPPHASAQPRTPAETATRPPRQRPAPSPAVLAARAERAATQEARRQDRAAAQLQRAADQEARRQLQAQQAAERAERQRSAEERRTQRATEQAQRAVEQATRREVAAERRAQRETLKAQRAAERDARRQARADAQAAAPPKRRRPKRDATSQAFGTDPNRVYAFRHRLISLDALITSNTDTGAVNPAYDPTLQPRMRERLASQRQIEQLARNLVPESLLWDFHQLDKGAPIIGSDQMVESGNGRLLALRRAKADFPEQWASYQARLRTNLRAVGLDESDLAGIDNPVLVRERLSEVDRRAFAQEANAPPVLQMSTLENALIDSRRLSDAMLLRLVVKEEQSIDQALRVAGNRGFVRAFIGTLSENEAAMLLRRDGTLNQAGIWRIKAAVFTRVFPGEAGQRLAETFLESLDSTTKNVENAISATLPALAHAESLLASGQRDAELSLAGDIGRALDMFARLKEQELPVPVYIEQASMFARELTPLQERLLLHFDAIGRSPKALRAFLNDYASAIDLAPDPAQESLFDLTPLTKDALLDRILDQPPQAKAA